MALARKPKKKVLSEADIDAVIDKGGTSPAMDTDQCKLDKTDKVHSVKLLLATSHLKEIDNVAQNRKPKISRHLWILEALYERIEREKNK